MVKRSAKVKKMSANVKPNKQVSPLAERCYKLLLSVPKGRVTTYKELAIKLRTRGYRAIGQIVGSNPFAPSVPCHRVVCTTGELGGYAGGIATKRRLLLSEGVAVSNGRIVDFSRCFYRL